jgi:hypothetical protein
MMRWVKIEDVGDTECSRTRCGAAGISRKKKAQEDRTMPASYSTGIVSSHRSRQASYCGYSLAMNALSDADNSLFCVMVNGLVKYD